MPSTRLKNYWKNSSNKMKTRITPLIAVVVLMCLTLNMNAKVPDKPTQKLASSTIARRLLLRTR